jgi:flagellar biosynthesis protein FliQ
MDTGIALGMMAELFRIGLVVSAPVLAATLVVGVAISMLQVVTQVQEMSLTFVPKLAVAVIVLVIAGPWMLRTVVQFAARLWTGIPSLT